MRAGAGRSVVVGKGMRRSPLMASVFFPIKCDVEVGVGALGKVGLE